MTIDVYRCTPRQARKYVTQIITAGLVPFVQSSPGMGKSSIMRSIADDFNLKLIDHRLSTSVPEDLTGLPRFHEDGYAEFIPFSTFPVAARQIPKGFEGWMLLLDEFNSAPKAVQAAAYKLVLDRMVGEHHLHERVVITAAGNLASDKAIVNALSTAMQSRLIHIEMRIDKDEWIEDVALKQGYDSRIIGYLEMKPSMLMNFDPNHQDKTFNCPRTWEFANKLITEVDEQGNKTQRALVDEDVTLLGGTLNAASAAEFVAFCHVWGKLPKIDEIIKHPLTTPVASEDEADIGFATLMYVMDYSTPANINELSQYVDRMPMTYRLVYYRLLLARDKIDRRHPVITRAMGLLSRYLHGRP